MTFRLYSVDLLCSSLCEFTSAKHEGNVILEFVCQLVEFTNIMTGFL